MVARGIVFCGSFTSSAGIEADSIPKKAQRVSIAPLEKAPKFDSVLTLKNWRFFPSMKKTPMMAIRIKGTNFRIVKTS